jgi:RNAse (barnase) inhibitor barstar
MEYEKLLQLSETPFFITPMDNSELTDLHLFLSEKYQNAVIKIIRGEKSKSKTPFFNEVSAALQFPAYFGENWDAFEECINDLEWLPGDAYILLVSEATQLFGNAKYKKDFRTLIEILEDTNKQKLEVKHHSAGESKPVSFHVVFQCTETKVNIFKHRLDEVSAKYEILDFTPLSV